MHGSRCDGFPLNVPGKHFLRVPRSTRPSSKQRPRSKPTSFRLPDRTPSGSAGPNLKGCEAFLRSTLAFESRVRRSKFCSVCRVVPSIGLQKSIEASPEMPQIKQRPRQVPHYRREFIFPANPPQSDSDALTPHTVATPPRRTCVCTRSPRTCTVRSRRSSPRLP
jgi:hypothetical protein